MNQECSFDGFCAIPQVNSINSDEDEKPYIEQIDLRAKVLTKT